MVLRLVQRDGENYTCSHRKGQQKNQVTSDIAGRQQMDEYQLVRLMRAMISVTNSWILI